MVLPRLKNIFLWRYLVVPLSACFSHSVMCFPVRRVPPRFSIPPTDNEIMPGGSVNITCVAVGSPMPYVKWMLGAEDLTPEDDMPIGRNVLELTDVRQSANYTCVAMSTLGVIEAVAQITVKGRTAACSYVCLKADNSAACRRNSRVKCSSVYKKDWNYPCTVHKIYISICIYFMLGVNYPSGILRVL